MEITDSSQVEVHYCFYNYKENNDVKIIIPFTIKNHIATATSVKIVTFGYYF